jgi:hypothetical protein
VAVITTGHPLPWWPYVLLLALAVLGGIGYVAGQSDPDPREPATVPTSTAPQPATVTETVEYFVTEPADMPPVTEARQPPRGPVITDRWQHTSDGARVPALMGMTHTGVTHRGYMERPSGDAPPSVKIGMLVACQSAGPALSGTELRAKFAAFLGCPAMDQLLAALTEVGPGMSWKNLAGNGPRTLEAALTAAENPWRASRLPRRCSCRRPPGSPSTAATAGRRP